MVAVVSVVSLLWHQLRHSSAHHPCQRHTTQAPKLWMGRCRCSAMQEKPRAPHCGAPPLCALVVIKCCCGCGCGQSKSCCGCELDYCPHYSVGCQGDYRHSPSQPWTPPTHPTLKLTAAGAQVSRLHGSCASLNTLVQPWPCLAAPPWNFYSSGLSSNETSKAPKGFLHGACCMSRPAEKAVDAPR